MIKRSVNSTDVLSTIFSSFAASAQPLCQASWLGVPKIEHMHVGCIASALELLKLANFLAPL